MSGRMSLDEEQDIPLLRPPSSELGEETAHEEPRARGGLFASIYRFLDGPVPRQPPMERLYLAPLQRRLRHSLDYGKTPLRVLSFWVTFYLFWFGVSATFIHRSSFSATSLNGSKETPVFLSCTSTLWRLKNGCGLDGRNCEPMNGTSIDFRCPANCRSEVVLNDRAVGDALVIHVPFVIGGGRETSQESGIYRADSMVCAAAIHAGLVRDGTGGCGRLNVRGRQVGFEAIQSNGVRSIAFDSDFPKSFSFSKEGAYTGCTDMRWTITAVNAVFSAVHSVLQHSSLSYYWVLFIALFFHVALVSDPPSTTGAELLSVAFEGLLPSLFVGYVFWITAARWTLDRAPPLDRTLFWLGGLWFGALLNYISDKIPISRLLMSDIVRDGGIFWFFGVLLLIVAIMVGQMNVMRKAGDLLYYLKIYLTGLAILIAISCIPGLTFRLHHYIFGMLFVPGTAYPTRLSMLYQGILIGLFLDGIARWGFDSILETADHLRGDAALSSARPVITSVGDWLQQGYLEWTDHLPEFHQFSVLINDVERYRGLSHRLDPRKLGLELIEHVPYYLRVAFALGDQALDYTTAATFYANGTVVRAPPLRIG